MRVILELHVNMDKSVHFAHFLETRFAEICCGTRFRHAFSLNERVIAILILSQSDARWTGGIRSSDPDSL